MSVEKDKEIFDIVYYDVPEKNRCIPTVLEKLYNLNLEEWKEFIVADSEKIYENRRWFELFSITFFADKADVCAHFLWKLKLKYEKLFIIQKNNKNQENKKYSIESEEDLLIKLDEINIQRKSYHILYVSECEINKVICYDSEEILRIFVKIKIADEVERKIGESANKGDFLKYELGRNS